MITTHSKTAKIVSLLCRVPYSPCTVGIQSYCELISHTILYTMSLLWLKIPNFLVCYSLLTFFSITGEPTQTTSKGVTCPNISIII